MSKERVVAKDFKRETESDVRRIFRCYGDLLAMNDVKRDKEMFGVAGDKACSASKEEARGKRQYQVYT